jgi:hypothetical protein
MWIGATVLPAMPLELLRRPDHACIEIYPTPL